MAVDYKLIKESGLENVYKRMRQINEYILADGMREDNDNFPPDPNQPNDAQQGAAPMPDVNNNGGNPQMPAPDPNADDSNTAQNNGGDTPMPGGENNMPEPPAQPDPTIGAEAPDTTNPEGNDDEVEDVEMEGDDEVVDVDDLTNSQEASEYKIDGVDDKLSKLLAIAGKFAQAIADNDQKLNDLRAEVEQRNPTDLEKINIRSQNSKPFNVNPGEYWEEQSKNNPNYKVYADNEISPDKEDKTYTITNDDLKNFNNSEVEKSFDDMPKSLMDYFK